MDIESYERGIWDGIRIAAIEQKASEEIVHVNNTQTMLIELALDWAVQDKGFRQAMLQRYDQLTEKEDGNG